MLEWQRGEGWGRGKEQEKRGEIPLVGTGRKAKDGEVGSITWKMDQGKQSRGELGEVRVGYFGKTLHAEGVGH